MASLVVHQHRPDPVRLAELVSIIRDGVVVGVGVSSTSSRRTGTHEVLARLRAFMAGVDDYPWYLGWVLCVGADVNENRDGDGDGDGIGSTGSTGVDVGTDTTTATATTTHVRMSAGLVLKNELRRLAAVVRGGANVAPTNKLVRDDVVGESEHENETLSSDGARAWDGNTLGCVRRWLPLLVDLAMGGLGLGLEERGLRHTVGTVVAGLVGLSWVVEDGGSMGRIVAGLDSSLASAVAAKAAKLELTVGMEGAVDVLVKVWEDCGAVLLGMEGVDGGDDIGDCRGAVGINANGIPRWDVLWARVLGLLQTIAATNANANETAVLVGHQEHPPLDQQIVQKLITTMNYTLYNHSSFLDTPGVLENYITCLFALAPHPAPAVRRVVCVGLNHCTELAPSKLVASNRLPDLIGYMIQATEDTSAACTEVALEASEFWTVFAEAGFDGAVLRPFVGRIVPLLLRNMRFEEWDEEVAEAEMVEEGVVVLGGEEEDAAGGGAPVLRPHVGGGKGGERGRGVGGGGGGGGEGDGADDDDDDDDDTVWNLRKSAAAGLDMISSFLGDDILPILLPNVQACLNDTGDWRTREAAILALGAVSHGCHSGLAQHLDAILSAALPGLRDPRPMVRVISCWTLTRYSRQVIMRATEGDRRGLDAVLAGILERLLQDRNRVVQVSACGSLSTLIEEDAACVLRVEGYVDSICGALAFGLNGYGRRAMRAVYDATSVVVLCAHEHGIPLSSVASLSSSSASPSAPSSAPSSQHQQMLGCLFGKLDTFADGDPELLPYLDCLSNVCSVPCERPEHVADLEGLFVKLDNMIERYIIAMDSGAFDAEEAGRFIEHLLDAVDGLVQGFQATPAPANPAQALGRAFDAAPSLGPHLVRAAQSSLPSLLTATFGLLGDLLATPPPFPARLLPFLSPLLTAILATLHPTAITPATVDACNNAAWSLGRYHYDHYDLSFARVRDTNERVARPRTHPPTYSHTHTHTHTHAPQASSQRPASPPTSPSLPSRPSNASPRSSTPPWPPCPGASSRMRPSPSAE